MEKAYKYWLADERGTKINYETDNNSVVIIGANGSGKSKLGAWIEQKDFEKVHRIGVQRNLNFNENITLKSYSQAESLVFYGSDSDALKVHKRQRWNYGNSYTTQLMNDFENVLAALMALKNNENDKFIEECKALEKEGKIKPAVPKTSIDKLQEIWNEIFPQRELILEDSKFYAAYFNGEKQEKYSANQMSDGERSVLYLVAQVLCVPQDKILIMDEPEIHLHRSLMNRLWAPLEYARRDCLFIYITHDTQFAASHNHAQKVWVQEFDGVNWKLQPLVNNDIPEELLLDILGNRKNVLFVEGEKDSYDSQLYSTIYLDYYVVPCGSCTQVIARTKAFKKNTDLHHCEVYGIIDRDYRSDYEIESYKQNNIYTLQVAEVENLFLVEELVRVFAEHMGLHAEEVFNRVKDYVINQRYANEINGQICESAVAQIKYKLNCAEISKKNETEARSTLKTVLESINYDEIEAEEATKFQKALTDGDYKGVIRVFNKKEIVKSIGHFLGVPDKAYCQTIINLLKTDRRDSIIESVLPYVPTEIPR